MQATEVRRKLEWYNQVMPVEKNPYLEEILAFPLSSEAKDRAFTAMLQYRTAALAIAKLPIPRWAKERKVQALQDDLYNTVAELLKAESQSSGRLSTLRGATN